MRWLPKVWDPTFYGTNWRGLERIVKAAGIGFGGGVVVGGVLHRHRAAGLDLDVVADLERAPPRPETPPFPLVNDHSAVMTNVLPPAGLKGRVCRICFRICDLAPASFSEIHGSPQ